MNKITVRFYLVNDMPDAHGEIHMTRREMHGTVEGYVHDGRASRAIVRSGPDLHDLAIGDLKVIVIPTPSY